MIESLCEYELILESGDLAVRRKAATESATTEVWVEILSQRPDLAEEVAFNKNLPSAVLDILVNNSSPIVRAAIAMKRCLADSQFAKLASDMDESVRIMVANNKKVPTNLLEKFMVDPCERVARAARAQLQNRS